MSTKPIKVFYAWQSDRDEKICHYFIRDALVDAIKEINEEQKKTAAQVEEADAFPEVLLDHDTKNVPGSPKIADVIERKIAECDVFVADLTNVSDYITFDKRPKSAQNGNVLIELGEALVHLPAEKILLLMNTAFGEKDHLPFDLHLHRGPLTYSLPDRDDAARLKAERASLAGKLKNALKMIYQVLQSAQDRVNRDRLEAMLAVARDKSAQDRAQFEEAVVAKKLKLFDAKGETVFSLCLHPLLPIKRPLDLGGRERDLDELIPFSGRAWDHRHYAEDFTRFVAPEGASQSVASIHTNGVIYVADSMQRTEGNWWKKAVKHLDWERQEVIVIRRVAAYLRVLRRLGVAGPVNVGMSILGVQGVVLFSDARNWIENSPRACDDDTTHPNAVEIPGDVGGSDLQVVARALKPTFDYIWRSAGAKNDPYYAPSGEYIVG